MQATPSLVQFEQIGLVSSHLTFLLLHVVHPLRDLGADRPRRWVPTVFCEVDIIAACEE